jgi:hypothetical protein
MGLGGLSSTGRAAAGIALATALIAGCGASSATRHGVGIPTALARESRPIGHGPRFHPPARGPIIGPCLPALGRRFGVHVEVFAANRVVLIAAGIGARPPLAHSEGRIVKARCYGALVTLEPTGVVLVSRDSVLSVGGLFHSWGQPLSAHRLASFNAGPGRHVAVFVDGRSWTGSPGSVPLTRHAEIVLEVGPHVPPHRSYTFPPGS